LLTTIDDFILDLDSEYSSDLEKMILGKVHALHAHLKALGFLDLAKTVDDSEPIEGNVINVLEVLRNYVMPETRRRLKERADQPASEDFWSYLHPRIRAVAQSRFDARHYADAVEAAMKEVNTEVKAHHKQSTGDELDGTTLMQKTFSPDNPIIPLADTSTETGKNIQKGYMFIFSGAMLGIRNPKAHANIEIDQHRAIHHLHLASLLMCVFDDRPRIP
jgi:uncharacterized protein (TIGR02391 family)